MATLTEASYYSRNIIKYGSIVVVILLAIRIGVAVFTTWWKRLHPPPPPPVTVEFGKLPALFPSTEKPEIKFRLETATGKLGEFGPQALVYLIPAKRGNLLALERATDLAKKMEFISEPTNSGTLYRWTKDKPLPSSLEIDIVSGDFTFDANWRVEPQLLTTSIAPSESEAIASARGWLSGMGLLEDDLEVGETRVTYLKVLGTDVVIAASPSEAQFVRVDLFRVNLEDARILPSNPDDGLVFVVALGSRYGRSQVVHGEYRYFPVDYTQTATYPLISVDTAWKRLAEGKAFLAILPKDLSEIAIRKVSLDYFDPPEAGLFLQPIFVFEGDGGFVGYVAAVSDEWIQE
ncbi:MAG: hypothetical protein A2900_02025 [Candidatus Chisholmbacteria bacterium RIFCSPLOWO2_01_FULL_50_28]|uniref:Uncharacterized protein n=1 Tax=Candidatus Chisholmbacteria bacterium RIFCSPHIGHO2_01_FULL_52_32 TaxID=1797591 RepID=A0A1G1VTP6_9BACT|nr:MAG: hypothetical protein A2786_04720 [Candidatus Chisholmbacteria bacterium RIFCSPHIGHO2_01_FULL_52_32]OGY19861.1 MAG: hypothetical protein A2900_02025 [Candidatus Chisholmbacteria bacterium RIFCSPLOWO2_01_FULL_50_28]